MNPRSLRSDGALRSLVALVLILIVGLGAALAQNNTSGAIFGRVQAGSTITAEHQGMGFKRSTVAGSDGSYRIAALPPGAYNVAYTDATGTARTRQIDVTIDTGTQVDGSGSDVLQLEKFVVGGMSVNPVDFSQTTSVSIYTDKQLDLLPVARGTTDIALLSPGTVTGDAAFPFPSFGGASVAENAYFINGFNVTSFNRGLGGATIPFEFYNQFEVNTGAYSAEFGRSTGGVINATSKSGSNQVHFAANVFYEPDDGRAKRPNIYYTNAAGAVVPSAYFSKRYLETWNGNASISGPLWKNRLFVYGLYQWRRSVDKDTNGTTRFDRTITSDPFWAVKVDFIPFQNHHFEYTGMDTSSRSTLTQWNYDFARKEIITSVPPGVTYSDGGGKIHIGRYTGTFFGRLTLSALVGQGDSNRTSHSNLDNISRVDDARTGNVIRLAGGPSLQITDAVDTRKAVRFDAEYAFQLVGSHRLRAGYDQEHNLSDERSIYGGGAAYRYETVVPGATLQGGIVPAGVTQAVRREVFRSGGAFTVDSDAWYVEDNWTTWKNRLVVRAGLRSESFVNRDKNHIPFISLDNQLAPRLGVAYDLFGNQKTKVFANYGRYHLPIASYVNSAQAGAQLLEREWFVLSSVGADFQPSLGAKIGDTAQTQAGIVRDQREITDQDIKPMSQDEWVLGVQHALNKKYKVGVRGIARDFGYAIDDMIVNHALVAWARANGYPNYTYSGPSTRAYVMANAGRPITMFWDFNKNGVTEANERAVLTPQMLGYPSAERKYYALEFTAEKIVDEKWGAQFSYTWAHSYGNYEGLVHSDSNQSQTSITRLFDSPALTTNTFGDQPNDKRHQFKLLGTYRLTREITVGTNLQLLSGRPRNRIGLFNDPLPLNATTILGTQYGAHYLLQPRGSVGRTPWQFRQDLTANYRPRWVAKDRLTFSVTVFNLLNKRTPTEYEEHAQTSTGAAELTYGLPLAWLSPRSVRLSARFEY